MNYKSIIALVLWQPMLWELFLLLGGMTVNSTRLAMKVVESPVAYGFNNDLIAPASNHDRMATLTRPSNFSGPERLRQLVGQCFNYTNEQYLYIFCPFDNITQIELSNRWNAFQGILGIWHEWKIVNNTFYSMMMTKGESCGSVDRSVEVLLQCGETNKIDDLSEPVKCQYQMAFETHLACTDDALLVYPRLPARLQHQWDQLITDLAMDDITEKGYDEGLSRIFIEAEYQRKKEPRGVNASITVMPQTTVVANDTSKYAQCLEEVAELKKEIEALKVLMEINTLSNTREKRAQYVTQITTQQ